MKRFNNKVIWITGASSGIGEACAYAFAKEGAILILTALETDLLEKVKAGEKNYHFIEIMGCPGGCVTGGGQPIVSSQERWTVDPKLARASAIYEADRELPLRKSHENPSVKKIYAEYFEKPNSHKAHELLHTHYVARKKY